MASHANGLERKYARVGDRDFQANGSEVRILAAGQVCHHHRLLPRAEGGRARVAGGNVNTREEGKDEVLAVATAVHSLARSLDGRGRTASVGATRRAVRKRSSQTTPLQRLFLPFASPLLTRLFRPSSSPLAFRPRPLAVHSPLCQRRIAVALVFAAQRPSGDASASGDSAAAVAAGRRRRPGRRRGRRRAQWSVGSGTSSLATLSVSAGRKGRLLVSSPPSCCCSPFPSLSPSLRSWPFCSR